MIENNASHKWLIERNLLAFPFGWQRPAKTEEWVYQQYIDQLPESVFYQIVCFPWATLIDLSQRNLSKKSQSFLDQLNVAPPSTRLIRATVCQHIYAKDMLPWFHHLKITDLYWPHATQDEREIEGIRIHPFPLFPVQCERFLHEVNHIVKPIADRKFLYSFVGAYTPGLYITPVREWLFSLPLRQDAYVMKRDEWHYERQVYGEQIAEQVITQDEKMAHESRSIEYVDSLCDSVFSLCPSGSGPNSIRLWESLGYGSIPVILSDTLRLPGELKEWEQAVVFVPEEEESVSRLPALLENIASDESRLLDMQAAGRVLWKKYGRQGPLTLLSKLRDTSYIAELIGHPQKKTRV